MLSHCGIVFAASSQQAAVNFGMQGFQPPVHHLREAGVIGHFDYRDATGAEQFGGAAGGQQFHPPISQSAGEIHQPGFVGNAE
jgi:hypothetical protein